jgi:hypothetical protein
MKNETWPLGLLAKSISKYKGTILV